SALGVVYGDIGTSPLYAVNEIFFGRARNVINQGDVLGLISIIFWALTLTVAIKYVILVLQADSEGEGGVFALFSLIRNNKKKNAFTKILITLLIIAAGLLLGDGIITPAISVVSAVEGLKVATSALNSFIVPITILILTGLFFIQSSGTHKIGKLFGPIIIVWFVSIGILGLRQVLAYPSILMAVNPLYAIQFFMTHEIHTLFIVLGSVMLVLTGGEAMYADMGHFGKKPIRLSWFTIVYPALLMNYFGQGAYMLSGNAVIADNIFYSMVPKVIIFPMVILATFATIIASQALISGAFSLIAQGISLGLLPFIKITHTHQSHRGQIFIPTINWMLYVGSVTLVLVFQSSARLASAYGLAVSGVMLVTTLSMIAVSRYVWKWNWLGSLAIFIPFALLDLMFLSANSLKLLEGGYIPLGIGLLVLIVIKSWQWGRSFVNKEYNSFKRGKISDILVMKENKTYPEIPKAYIFMTPRRRSTIEDMPTLMQIFIDRYGALPKHIIFLTVSIEKHPYVTKERRYEITHFGKVGPDYDTLASVVVRFGFMEEPNVEKVLQDLANHKQIQIDTDKHNWLIEVMHERIYEDEVKGFNRVLSEIYKLISRFADTADHYFKLGDSEPLAIEVVPVKLK
ncbi:MAG: KUP/HAK/KT family potassium transporter, partial [Candidatus Roizmanbacteria bacterium]|nr:KUP/HAK/KT family potassium transporter [Candidatus Roizmanbacteria bacterium]